MKHLANRLDPPRVPAILIYGIAAEDRLHGSANDGGRDKRFVVFRDFPQSKKMELSPWEMATHILEGLGS